MLKHVVPVGFVSTVVALAVAGNAAVFALEIGKPVHTPAPVTSVTVPPPTSSNTPTTSSGNSNGTSGTTAPQPAATAPSSSQQPLTAVQQQACQIRATTIDNIMSRIDTRTQNQITLFGTIATRVKNFYTSKSKTVSNYDQLTAAITTAQAQAKTSISAMQANSTIDCKGANPKGMVTAFQGYLKTETTDLQNYRTAVENLIEVVAAANGITVSKGEQ